MQIKAIFVDELPKSYGECLFMRYENYAVCCALPDAKDSINYYNEIQGIPTNMNYRRSDCPLSVYER